MTRCSRFKHAVFDFVLMVWLAAPVHSEPLITEFAAANDEAGGEARPEGLQYRNVDEARRGGANRGRRRRVVEFGNDGAARRAGARDDHGAAAHGHRGIENDDVLRRGGDEVGGAM